MSSRLARLFFGGSGCGFVRFWVGECWAGFDKFGLDWFELNEVALGWLEFGRVGLGWIGLHALDWTGLGLIHRNVFS